ncbi:MAG TPA: hypothetical protein VG713_07480 [Pirellulales bacterium]|nr:hypothetical protein [Pirellulales bacterium]
MALERSDLAARLGPEILHRLDQAHGRASEAIIAYRPPPAWSICRSFEFAIESREALEAVMAEMLKPITRQLADRHEGIERLRCGMECDSGRRLDLLVGLYRATADVEHLMELVRLHLDCVRLPGPVQALQLEATHIAPLDCHQQEMFDGASRREEQRRLAVLVDRLSSRLGWDRVTRPSLRAEVQPEYAWSGKQVVGSGQGAVGGKQKRKKSSVLTTNHDPLTTPPRPLRLVREPIAIQVMSVVPAGGPHRVDAPGHEHRVVRSWGPERIETGWWRGRGARRDYYCVETATGRWLWVFRELNTDRWYLHGWND